MADSASTEKDVQGVTRRRLLQTVSTAAVVGIHSALGGSKATAASPTPAASPSALMGPRPAKKLRMAVVGGGFGSHFYWHEHPDCEVTAVSDLRPDRQKILAQKYRCDNVYGEFHPMLKDPKVDAVAIFTDAPLHVDHCVDVLNSGKHVVCAVPAAFTLEQCQRLVDTVKKTGLTYMQAETSCYSAGAMTAYKLAREGKFGTIYYTQGEYLHDQGGYHPGGKPDGLLFGPQGQHTWRYGYPPAKYPTHSTGAIIMVTDDPMTEVSCISWGPKNNPYADSPYHNRFWNVTFLAKTRAGNASRICIHNCFGGLGDICERAEFWGTEMVYLEPRFGTPALMSREGEKLAPAPLDDHTDILPPNMVDHAKVGHGGAEVFITNEFVRANLDGRAPRTDVYQGVAYCAPGICAFDSSNRDAEWVKVPDFGWHS